MQEGNSSQHMFTLKMIHITHNKEDSPQMAMNNMKSNQQNTSQLTTQRTKENEENSLLSLTD